MLAHYNKLKKINNIKCKLKEQVSF